MDANKPRRKVVIHKTSFNVDVYSTKINVIILATGKDVSNRVRALCRKLDADEEGIPSESYGYAITFPSTAAKTYYLFYAAEGINYDTITHETYHITEYIAQFNSLVQDDNKEASANLNGYINKRVFQAFAAKDIPISYE